MIKKVEADGLGYDSRLVRRLKRSLAPNIDTNAKTRKKRKNSNFYDAVGDDLVYDVRLARRLKRNLASDIDLKPNVSGKNSFSGGKRNGASRKIQKVILSNNDDDNDYVDADYKIFLDSLSSHLTCDDVDGYENALLQIDAMNIDADTNRSRNLQSTNIEIGEIVDADVDASYYRSYLDILALEDENACFIDRGRDVDAINQFPEKENSGENLIGDKFLNFHVSDTNNDRKRKRNSDCLDGVAVANDAESIENVTFNNFSENSGNVNDTCQDDDVDYTDPAYDYALKNMIKDGNDTSLDFSDNDVSLENQSENNSGSQNDGLDNIDPDYELFMKNVRQDGTSLVLEIPVVDGISQVIRYELGDGYGVENLDTTRSRQEELCEPDSVDETYGEFMKYVKSEKGLLVYTPECGPRVVYDEEEDEESSSDSDVVILEPNPLVHQTYDIPSDGDEEECNKGWFRENDRWFREKVMEILKKPFDKEEYNRLLHDAMVHRPIFQDSDNRSGRSRQRYMFKSGKSHLDEYKDLSRRITMAGASQPKVLNLLRGYFFWLQNISHQVFKPWEDEQCLRVLPSPEVASRRHYRN